MRSLIAGLAVLVFSTLSMAQETAGFEVKEIQPPSIPVKQVSAWSFGFMRPQQVKALVKQQLKRAIDGKQYPTLGNWHPLTPRQKFDVFVAHTYSPNTFLGAGIDALKFATIGHGNSEYERGFAGFGQRYGINLATSETNVFFERFLLPTVLKQDPRYFRNPERPFVRRALYSISRVLITHADSGQQTFNASKILGGAASQAIADLYVPGERQGLHPILGRVTFNLVRDAGLNMVHEFWPDIHRGLLHRFSFIRNVSSRLD
ncbi:MAG TPA: hypothetical protein VG649_13570 [Candidatus Angelobacter sp.]|nr:hypothetical protein [Candidatus Angelobacter sp.]